MRFILFLNLTLATLRIFPQTNPLFRHLPPDAAAIFHFNLPVLTTRMSWKELTEHIPFPQINTANHELVTILRTPALAGVDSTRDLFLVIASSGISSAGRDPRGQDSVFYISLLLQLADSAKFTAFLRGQEPGIHIATTPYGSYLAGRNRMGAAWDHDLAIMTFAHPSAFHSPHPGPVSLPPAPLYTTLALGKSAALFRGFEGSARILDPLFLTGFSDDADLHAWTLPGAGTIHTLTSLRFDIGQITIKSTTALPGTDSARSIADPGPATGLISETPLVESPSGATPLSIRLDSRTAAAFIRHIDKTPSGSSRSFLPILDALNQFLFTAGRLINGQLINLMEIKMADPAENSLRGLFRLFL